MEGGPPIAAEEVGSVLDLCMYANKESSWTNCALYYSDFCFLGLTLV